MMHDIHEIRLRNLPLSLTILTDIHTSALTHAHKQIAKENPFSRIFDGFNANFHCWFDCTVCNLCWLVNKKLQYAENVRMNSTYWYMRFHGSKFLQGGVISPTPNPRPGGPGYLSQSGTSLEACLALVALSAAILLPA
jgi:hypothetical protein